ncbi:MAG: class IV adenylate cyclase [Candidatus Woesearchaeota archaeon]
MKEIEILIKVNEEKETITNILKKYKFIGLKKTLDIYYYHEYNNNLNPKSGMPVEWFRLRNKNKEYSICYKKDTFQGKKWLYSDEYETKVADVNNAKKIIEKLGYKELIRVDVIKNIYEDKNYEIVLEEVKKLGLFLEIESKKSGNVKKIRKNILKLIKSFNIKYEEMNKGKPEMLLSRRKIK